MILFLHLAQKNSMVLVPNYLISELQESGYRGDSLWDDIIDWFEDEYGIIIYTIPLRDQTVSPERFLILPAIVIKGIDPDIYQDPWDADTIVENRHQALELAVLEGINLIKVRKEKNTID